MNYKGLVRDTLPINNPEGTAHWGKNMLYKQEWNSSKNEDGFDFEYLVNGIVIGVISTNSDIVYFIKNNEGVDEIGVVNLNTTSPVYETKIKTNLFNFGLGRPIEGIFIYNFKNELIVSFSDGIKDNSNSPFVINLDDLPVEIDANKNLVNSEEFTKLLMFPAKNEADIEVSFLETGNFEYSDVYITYTYILNNNTSLPYFSTSTYVNLSKINEQDYNVTKKGIQLNLTDLDLNFSKLKIGLVFKANDSSLFAYESNEYSYNSNTLEILINDLNNFNNTNADELVLNPIIIDKFNTITKNNSQVFIGNIATKPSIKFQKFANLLNIVPILHEDEENIYGSLQPDEVYSFYIELQNLDGSYTNGYHIPNLSYNNSELESLTVAQKSTYNLDWVENDYKQFHIFNEGVFNIRCGFWQNIETYPDSEEFDSTVDYNNNPLIGRNLRNQPIKYHRMPELKKLYEGNYPTIYGNNGVDNFTQHPRINKKIGIRLVNFDNVVPDYIKDRIQGYRISIVKRTNTNNYVLGNWLGFRRDILTDSNGIEHESSIPIDFREEISTRVNGLTQYNYRKFRLYNPELLKFKPSLSPTYIKINYYGYADYVPALNPNARPGNYNNYEIQNEYKFVKCESNVTYRLPNNIADKTLYSEEAANLDLNDSFDFNNLIDSDPRSFWYYFNTMGFSLKLNLYSGFSSSDLVIIGKSGDFSNNKDLKGGDTFLSSMQWDATHIRNGDINGTHIVDSYTFKYIFNTFFSSLNNKILENNSEATFQDYIRLAPSSLFFGDQDVRLGKRVYEHTLHEDTALSFVNDLATIITFNSEEDFIDRFPYRIYKGLQILSENLSESFLRTFLANDYYDMPNDKGEIIALRGSSRKLYIQQRYALYLAEIKDILENRNNTAYLGYGTLFDRPPLELLSDTKGYIGSNSKFACIIIKGMYLTIQQDTGQVFLVQNGVNEISAIYNKIWFWENWKINEAFNGIDNPYISVGYLISYDRKHNRLLFIKKTYDLLEIHNNDNTITFDGEFYYKDNILLDFNNLEYFKNNSKTLSFDIDSKMWLFEHDYKPNIIFHTNNNLFSGINNLSNNSINIYKHNSLTTKGEFYGQKYDSYIEVIFNKNLNITKLYQSIHWVTSVINLNKGEEQYKTINKILIYNDSQCSGIINLNECNIKPRKNEWFFNDFRDLLLNENLPIVDDNGELLQENINNFKVWFEKSNFISKFIVVRLIIDNIDNDDVYINKVNVKSIIKR